ncbi:hypothetical protein ABW19_dt0205492 [Dactylella cylindrospora]|nr:hypothetical protein ABW19_dt0205492 [Dactylella cylindrospora]
MDRVSPEGHSNTSKGPTEQPKTLSVLFCVISTETSGMIAVLLKKSQSPASGSKTVAAQLFARSSKQAVLQSLALLIGKEPLYGCKPAILAPFISFISGAVGSGIGSRAYPSATLLVTIVLRT